MVVNCVDDHLKPSLSTAVGMFIIKFTHISHMSVSRVPITKSLVTDSESLYSISRHTSSVAQRSLLLYSSISCVCLLVLEEAGTGRWLTIGVYFAALGTHNLCNRKSDVSV